MFIRIGFEIVIESKAETVLILALSPHSSFSGRIVGSDEVQAEPALPLETFTDTFGNRLTRLRAPVGTTETLVRLHRRGGRDARPLRLDGPPARRR